MKLLGIVVGLLALFMFVGSSFARTELAAKAPKAVQGKITDVAKDGTTITVTPKAKAGTTVEDVKITTDDKTKVTVDGAAATIGDLKVGMTVKVTPATGTAATIDAKNPKKKNQ
ncbi:MAG: hypothetical protein ACHRHE_00780 [Tepidisphaerales bacterium]